MTFWKENRIDPVRKFRFKVIDQGGEWWWVKQIDKPSFEINTAEYQLANQKFTFPGLLVWNDIQLTIYDVGKKAVEILNRFMSRQGYQSPDDCYVGIQKVEHDSGSGLKILQYNGAGKMIETWELFGSFIKAVDFGTLDYSSDDLVEIKITIAYDFAEINGGVGTQTQQITGSNAPLTTEQ